MDVKGSVREGRGGGGGGGGGRGEGGSGRREGGEGDEYMRVEREGMDHFSLHFCLRL